MKVAVATSERGERRLAPHTPDVLDPFEAAPSDRLELLR
jgi:hypothetical protein